jgi:citrate synthase
MGMGHRIYRVRDPRAAVFEVVIADLAASGMATPRLALARAVENAAAELLRERKPDRPLCANVEFYTAVLLDTLQIPRDLFTAMFALGRLVGWAAHVVEQRRTGKLIRPASVYVGVAVA